MFPLLLAACPSFGPTWSDLLQDWQEEPLPHYLALAEFARHLIAMLERADTSTFPAVFRVVERLHLEGEHYVREAATIGLLESLQNTDLYTKTEPDQFRPFLEEETKKWWDKLHGFWERGEFFTEGF